MCIYVCMCVCVYEYYLAVFRGWPIIDSVIKLSWAKEREHPTDGLQAQ